MIPLKDSLLVPFSGNFNERINADPGRFHLSTEQAAAYTAVHEPYVAAHTLLMANREAGVRSEAQTNLRDSTRSSLLAYARQLYAFVQANAAVSDADKITLGIHVRGAQSRIPRPSAPPEVIVAGVEGRTVSVRVFDAALPTKRGKADAAVAAWIYSFVGEAYPADPTAWSFRGAATRATYEITFPATVAGGTRVWIMAAWINSKQEPGPTSVPVTTNLQGGGSMVMQGLRAA